MYTYDTKKPMKSQQTATKTTTPNSSGNFQMDSNTSNSARLEHPKACYAQVHDENTVTNSENDSGGEKLQAAMKAKMEARFPKINFDDVRVHKNSDKPEELGARAYTKGSQIHIASGEEDTLEHELGHVVQQKQGRVKGDTQVNGANANESPEMEKEADTLLADEDGEVVQMRKKEQKEAEKLVHDQKKHNHGQRKKSSLKGGQIEKDDKRSIREGIDQRQQHWINRERKERKDESWNPTQEEIIQFKNS